MSSDPSTASRNPATAPEPFAEGFSLQLTTAQPIDDIARQIVARGGVLETEPTDVWGVRVFRLRDPDGFRFTISSPRAT